MITQKALLSEAERMGLKVTDAELREVLRQGLIGDMLFPSGNFIGEQAYENFVPAIQDDCSAVRAGRER